MYQDLPLEDDEPDTSYKANGVHMNRPESAKMNVEATDRDGFTQADKQAQMEEAVAATEPKDTDNMQKRIGVDERVYASKRDPSIAQQTNANVNRASASMISEVEPGQYLPPVPGSGTQASYGDGLPQGQGGGGGMNVDVDFSYSGGEGGQGFSMDGMSVMGMGGGSMGGGGGGAGGASGGGGGGSGMSSAGAAQLGQDIAAMDDTMDQAEEKMFQDDRTADAMEAYMHRIQGR